MLLCAATIMAQQVRTVTGLVVDSEDTPLIGATVVVKGTTIGTSTDTRGAFSLEVPVDAEQVLVVSYVGMETQEVNIFGLNYIQINLKESVQELEDVVVVGYGTQKKESVVGAISQTTGDVLERSGGVNNIGAALTGNIPGLITLQTTGKPGEENPKLYIRGQGTWNNSDPLILVDGIERSMEEIDFASVENISVLKDASATAVFGVKGANGVILITTKRGREGRSNITASASTTMKIPSLIPTKYDAYDALKIRNYAVEREVVLDPDVWQAYTPLPELDKYRNPSSPEEAERYPNIDWQEESFKDFAMSYTANIGISGGTGQVRYFTSMDYLHEGDIMQYRDNGKGYEAHYGYDRMNFRSNLDFLITRTTTLSANLSGSYSNRQDTWSGFEYRMWQGVYANPPDAMQIQYGDGAWGFYPNDPIGVMNSVRHFSNEGIEENKKSIINTDFTLKQDLNMILKGLSVKGIFSLDNTFNSNGGLYDNGSVIAKWISPEGEVRYENYYSNTNYDYVVSQWSVRPDNMGATYRKIFYQAQADFARQFGKHDVTAMGLFSRDQYANGSEFPHYREDWVFRTTYNFDLRYFLEFNGSYNGSEKFSNEYRFEFFPSAAVGWMLSNENFMKNISWLEMFKIRASYGLVGNDNISGRWLYQTLWEYGGNSILGSTLQMTSPYTWYTEGTIGNPDIHWETVTKKNLGFEFGFLRGLIKGTVDLFNDYRTDILIAGGNRALLDYLGGDPPTANLGEVEVKGYEVEVKLNRTFSNGLGLWVNVGMTHAVDKIIFADDPALLPTYQKDEGYQIGQYRSQVLDDFINTWDELYASTRWETNNQLKLPGEYNVIDFNGDGIINTYDDAPNGYPDRPQNTYNSSLGGSFRGFSWFIQFYGVSNVTRYISLTTFPRQKNTLFDQGTYWSVNNKDADSFVPRFQAQHNVYGNYYAYDGSYLRLKNVELAYTFNTGWVKTIGMESLRIYVNGNNLYLWTKMPDDRESNLGTWANQGAYPTVRRINLGLRIAF
ncbi:MAG: TonB-dependent receptor [Bacteroidales bacterium]|nr:TonB-dependent receptor [Bacteroidales bacterium]MBN2698875.1 TonB-dependent receptor [Bacteroidales bacterium]